MKRTKKQPHLIKGTGKYLIQFFVPLIVVFLILNIFALFIIRQQEMDRIQYELEASAGNLRNYIEQIEGFAFDISINDEIQKLLLSSNSPYISSYAQADAFDKVLGLNRYYDLEILYIGVLKPDANSVLSVGYIPVEGTEHIAEFSGLSNYSSWVPTGSTAYYARTSRSYDVVSFYQNVYQLSSRRFIGVIRMDIPLEKLYHICNPSGTASSMELYFKQEGCWLPLSRDSKILSVQAKPTSLTSKVNDFFMLAADFHIYDLIYKNHFFIPLSVFALIFCILFVLLAYRFLHFVVSPIYRLNESIQNMSLDKPSEKLTLEKGNREMQVIYDGFNQLTDNLNRYIDKNREIMQQEQQAKTLYFQSQINPHFLYNTLDTLRWIAIKNKEQEVAGEIYTLSNIYRYYLNQGASIVPVREELHLIQDFMSIQSLRFGEKYIFRQEVEESVKDCLIPKLLLQPLVENAVQHGFPDKEEDCFIMLSIKERNGQLLIRLLDNGCGISKELLKRIRNNEPLNQDSFAILNIKKRLELYYESTSEISFQTKRNGGTFIKITLPARKETEI